MELVHGPAGVPEHVHVLVNTFQQFNMAVNDMMAQILGGIFDYSHYHPTKKRTFPLNA